MAKKIHALIVRGRSGQRYMFLTAVDPRLVEGWQSDGIDIDPVANIIPRWVARIGCVRAWCFLQDIFNFKNPF